MNWNGTADSMAEAWVEAQRQMWNSWSHFAQSAPANRQADMNPYNQWFQAARQGVEAWTTNADSTMRRTADQLLDSQKALQNFYVFSLDVWKQMADQAAAGTDWNTVLNSYMSQLQNQFSSVPSAMSGNVEAAANQWLLFQQQMQHLLLPWMQLTKQAGANWPSFSEWTPFSSGITSLDDFIKQGFASYNQLIHPLLDSPPLGFSREVEELMRQSVKAWGSYQEASVEYGVVMADAWLTAFKRLQEELYALSLKGQTITTLQGVSNLWAEIADPAMSEVFVSERFVRAQGKLLTATMNLRIQQRAIIERISELFDIPTRTEVDEVHKTIYEQRKEIKALKNELSVLQSTAHAPASPEIVSSGTTKTPSARKESPKRSKRLKGSVTQSQKRQDDLKRIKGIGEISEAKLNGAGIFTYAEIAESSADQLAEIVGKERARLINTEIWIAQARELATLSNQEG